MKAVYQNLIPAWMNHNAVQTVMALLNPKKETIPETLFVGGCVRNWLMSREVADIDLATILMPEDVISICKKNKVTVIPTGIKHGTVTVRVEGQSFEVTTLRRDMVTDGRHADVAFTDDWLEDAKRRDFTINALYADNQGNIYDPLECGLDDLKAARIVFVGDADQRIQEDYLRILRFFRFICYYGEGKPDETALQACSRHAEKIFTLSLERITQEYLKILLHSKASETISLMLKHNIMPDIAGTNYKPEILQRLIGLQEQYAAPYLESRLVVLAGNKAHLFEKYLRLSHKQKNAIIKTDIISKSLHYYSNEKLLKKAMFYQGRDNVMHGYFLSCAATNKTPEESKMAIIKDWKIPVCPHNGKSLMAEGYEEGPVIGTELERRTEEWLDQIL